jgi:hypothetical protein
VLVYMNEEERFYSAVMYRNLDDKDIGFNSIFRSPEVINYRITKTPDTHHRVRSLQNPHLRMHYKSRTPLSVERGISELLYPEIPPLRKRKSVKKKGKYCSFNRRTKRCKKSDKKNDTRRCKRNRKTKRCVKKKSSR